MTDIDQVGGYELLHRLATKHGWKVRLITNRDFSHPSRTVADDGAPTRMLGLEVLYRDSRYVRRALGPGNENLDTAAFEILNSLRLLGVLSLQGPS